MPLEEVDEPLNSWLQTELSVKTEASYKQKQNTPWAEWGYACTTEVQVYYLSCFSVRRCYSRLSRGAGLKMMISSTDLDLCPSHKAEGEGEVLLLLLHSDSPVSSPVQQEGDLGYVPLWCLWRPEGPSQRPQVDAPAKKGYSELQRREKAPASTLTTVWVFHI